MEDDEKKKMNKKFNCKLHNYFTQFHLKIIMVEILTFLLTFCEFRAMIKILRARARKRGGYFYHEKHSSCEIGYCLGIP